MERKEEVILLPSNGLFRAILGSLFLHGGLVFAFLFLSLKADPLTVSPSSSPKKVQFILDQVRSSQAMTENPVTPIGTPSFSQRVTQKKQIHSTFTPPHPTMTIEATYPRISREKNEQGEVSYRAYVLPDGRVDSMTLIKSSGFPRLDRAAKKALSLARFNPAKKEGRRIGAETLVHFKFVLRP